jgi:hypothetical protein
MVRELHTMGYEQLRIAPNVAPSGLFWRLSICAAANTLPEHGAKMRDFDEGAHYSSGGEDRFFDWDLPMSAGTKTCCESPNPTVFPMLTRTGHHPTTA